MLIRQRLQDSEHKLGQSMPLDEAKERASQLTSEITLLERYFNIDFYSKAYELGLSSLVYVLVINVLAQKQVELRSIYLNGYKG